MPRAVLIFQHLEAPTQSASIRTDVNEMMTRFDLGRWPSSRTRLRSSRLAQNFREKALYGVHYHPERPCYISQLPRDLTNQISGLYVEPKGRLADAGFLAGRRRAVYISSFRLEPPLPRRRFYGAL